MSAEDAFTKSAIEERELERRRTDVPPVQGLVYDRDALVGMFKDLPGTYSKYSLYRVVDEHRAKRNTK